MGEELVYNYQLPDCHNVSSLFSMLDIKINQWIKPSHPQSPPPFHSVSSLEEISHLDHPDPNIKIKCGFFSLSL